MKNDISNHPIEFKLLSAVSHPHCNARVSRFRFTTSLCNMTLIASPISEKKNTTCWLLWSTTGYYIITHSWNIFTFFWKTKVRGKIVIIIKQIIKYSILKYFINEQKSKSIIISINSISKINYLLLIDNKWNFHIRYVTFI